MARVDTWMPMYWGDYAKDTAHLSAVHHGAYLMLIKHYWTQAAPLPDDDDQLWRIACADSLAHWRKIKPIVLAFFDSNDGLLRHGRVDEELAKAEGNADRRAEMARRAAEARWRPAGDAPRNARRNAGRNAPRMPDAMRGGCSSPSSSDDSHGDIHNSAARASASPDGPPRPQQSTDIAKWADRLAKHRPQDGKPCWTNAWGPQPDSAGHNPLIPPNLYRQWREQYDRDMAALKPG